MSKLYKCGDCIYFPKCDSYGWEDDKSEICGDYKDKSRFVELPCNVGDKVYQFDQSGIIYESEIVRIIYDTTSIAFDERAIGKSIFLTDEGAKKARDERFTR